MPHTLGLTHRLHMNGLAWAMDECLRHVRHGNHLPSPDLLKVMNALPQDPSPTLGVTLLLAATTTARNVVPGCLPTIADEGEVKVTLFMETEQGGANEDMQGLRALIEHAERVLGAALVQDRDQLFLTLRQTPPGQPTALVWAMCLMLIGLAMHAADPGRTLSPSPVLMRCLGCSTVLGKPHTRECSQARCADTGVPLGACSEQACPVTVWEGELAGAQRARALGLWCVDTAEGTVAVQAEHPHARPWAEEAERIGTWDRGKATWI